MGEIIAKGGISPQQALQDAFEKQNPRLARPASEHYAAGRRKGYKEARLQALREIKEHVDKIEIPDGPGHGMEALIVAGIKVKLDEMISKG